MSIRKFGEPERIEDWSRRMTQMMDEMLNRDYVQYRDSGAWQPPTNLYECGDSFFILVEIGGMEQSQIEVNCVNERLIMLTGTRGMPRRADWKEEICIHVMEIDEGPFRREIELPVPVIIDRVEATYDKGYLWIALPKKK